MKKQLLSLLCMTCFITIILNNLYGQSDNLLANNSFNLKKDIGRAGYTADIKNTHKIPGTYVTVKAIHSFDKLFNNTSHVEWYTAGKKYLTLFNSGGRTSKALFTKRGHVLYVINYGNEESLPREIRMLIRSSYIDYKIGRVAEVNAYNQTSWMINLQDDNNLVIVRIADGLLDEIEHYQTYLTSNKKAN